MWSISTSTTRSQKQCWEEKASCSFRLVHRVWDKLHAFKSTEIETTCYSFAYILIGIVQIKTGYTSNSSSKM